MKTSYRLTYTILFIVLLGFAVKSNAQVTHNSELGAGLGTFNYTGDLSRNYNFRFSQPALTVFYRYNISSVISFRAGLTMGFLGAKDKKQPLDAFSQRRDASFKIFLSELSGVFEYHFLNWRDGKYPIRFTPYLFAGLGIFSFSGKAEKTAEYSNVQLSIPFGGGFKYIITPYYYIGIEYGIRKTFFDYLDNLSDGPHSNKNYQYGNGFDKDSYYFLGVTITRTFYQIPCPKSPYKRATR